MKWYTKSLIPNYIVIELLKDFIDKNDEKN